MVYILITTIPERLICFVMHDLLTALLTFFFQGGDFSNGDGELHSILSSIQFFMSLSFL